MAESAPIVPAWLRFGDALSYASLSKHQLRPLLHSGDVYGKKVGRVWIVSRDSLDAFLNSDRTKARLVARSVLR